MNSPVRIPFSRFIKIDRRKSEALYKQIVYQFVQAVQRRLLEEGQKIPGSRKLGKELKVHRKTVVAALEELRMQDWIETKPAVGTFVKNPEAKTTRRKNFAERYRPDRESPFSFRQSFILDPPEEKNHFPHRFTEGIPDYRIIRLDELGRFYSTALKRKNVIKKIPHYLPQGNPFFKAQLSYYLNLTRGFHLSEDNLITANSKEALLYILTQLLVHTGDTVLVSEYSYYFSNMVFQQAGADVHTVPMDNKGMQVDFIHENFKPGELKFVYVCPQHQFPTTSCLYEQRRQKLIELAKAYHFIVIEEDSHHEMTYEKSVNLSLIKRDSGGRVIYLGGVGEFLPPGFHTNFVVATKDLIREARKYLNIFGKPDMVKEQGLGDMIYEGDLHRYRRKALRIYRSRRNHFASLLREYFPNILDFTVPKGGMAFWIQFRSPVPLSKLSAKSQTRGLYIPKTCLFQNKEKTALRLGFGHLDEKEMEEAVKTLRESYDAIIGFRVNIGVQQDT